MELEITRLLQGSGASGLGDEKGVEKSEEAEMVSSGLTEAQARAKHAELSKMRSLLFYEQQKRKRVSKIKSKAYHRIRKRQAARRGEGQDGEGDDLAELDPEAAAAAEEKEALARMEERAGLKHKNTSKWAKQQLKAGVHGSGMGRKAMGEQLRLGEELRKKATDKPKTNDGGSDDSDSSDDDEDYQGTAADARAEAVRETEALILGMNQDDDKASGSRNSNGHVLTGGSDQSKKAATKGLAGMKFMQKAAQKQREVARVEAEALLKELAEGERLSSDDEDEEEEEEEEEEKEDDVKDEGKSATSAPPQMLGESFEVVGRAGSGKRVRVDQAIDVGAAPSNRGGDATDGKKTKKGSVAPESGTSATVAPPLPAPTPEVANPWLDPCDSASRQKKRKAASSSSSEHSSSSSNVVDVDRATAAVLAGTEHEDRAAGAKDNAKKRVKGWAGTAAGGAHTMPPSSSSTTATTAKPKELSQAELVARAFAAPDFENEFTASKEAQLGLEAKAKAPEVESDGWGSWAGMGAPPPPSSVNRKPAVASKAKHNDNNHQGPATAPSGGAPSPSSRTDRSLPLVMINQKRVKAAARLKVEQVPYPFTSREQYERSLAVPIGKEWNGMRAARGFARPKVVTDAGRTIKPIKLAGGKKAQHQAPLSRAR